MSVSRAVRAAALLALLSLAAGCGDEGAVRKAARTPLVEAERAVSSTITRSIELTGTAEAARTARIASPAEGPVLELLVREGDVITKGDVLLTIGRREAAEDRADAAREELAREREELGRIEKLVESGALPGESLDKARLRVAEARARLSDALVSVEDYELRAPWDGEVSRVFVTEGYFVSPREDLVELFDPLSMVIRFSVPERDAVRVEEGTQIAVSLDAHGGRRFKARIERLYPVLDPRTRTRTVEAVLEDDIETAPGMFARLTVPVETAHDAVVVPAGAIVVTPREEKTIFLIEGGRALRREVETGIEQGGAVQITSGLAPGDSVVVSGNRTLRDGARVRVTGEGKEQDR